MQRFTIDYTRPVEYNLHFDPAAFVRTLVLGGCMCGGESLGKRGAGVTRGVGGEEPEGQGRARRFLCDSCCCETKEERVVGGERGLSRQRGREEAERGRQRKRASKREERERERESGMEAGRGE